MKIIVAGALGRFPIGGNAWVVMQYLLGLQTLGHEVYFLEECGEGSWVFDWESEDVTTDLDYPTGYLHDCLTPIGFGDRWIYRAGDQTRGMRPEAFHSLCEEAELLLILACPLDLWRQEYDRPRRRAFIDLDPGFTQIRFANGEPLLVQTLDRCEQLFTIGQRVGSPGCEIPTQGRQWSIMLPPISLPNWAFASGEASHFSTIMQWRSYDDVEFRGVTYGNKSREFLEIQNLPRLCAQPLRIALSGGDPEALRRIGWEVETGWKASFTPDSYQRFIQTSRAEVSAAKHGYVATRSGWISDRSVCYLASGRPVLVQDTGIGDRITTGRGLLTYTDVGSALGGIEAINGEYELHRNSARRLAEEIFAADRVLPPLVEMATE
jgi:hypothetical protein